MPGSSIGKGCIVSAFSYVNGVFPDFSVIAGNPAVVTGDTRTLDQHYLDQHPHLKEFYNQWSQ
jgi:acetyltransferase-like isoleucine patch superfamily enzyme